MLANLESFFHRLRRRFSRSERAVRRFRMSVAENCGEEPGLLLIQIGGLSQQELKSALADGRLPFFQRLLDREKYHLHPFHPGRGATRSSVQAEIYYGAPISPGPETESLLKDGSAWGFFLPGDQIEQPAAITAGAKIDLVRGLPVVHVYLDGSGELPPSRVDRAVHALTTGAHRSQRRDYHVWIFSDGLKRTGQEPGEPQGFFLTPPATWLPSGTESSLRPSDLRSAALVLLGRQARKRAMISAPPGRLAVMSYNVHSCMGMDGRVSPRRIARVIARQHVDLAALQELDHGRPRSRAEDQAGDIAAELGFHLVFCPAVVRGNERYGHALLSRWPLETVKVGVLPSHPGGVWPEPRAAIWARVHVADMVLNVLSTHLGLAAPERMKQMTAILGSEWLGPVLDREPVILCGDFNLTPGSAAHRLAASRLRDVAHNFKRGVQTFSSMRLVAQLDHIFVSPHFALESVFAAQNDLTRVASDHLPLVAHLRLPGK